MYLPGSITYIPELKYKQKQGLTNRVSDRPGQPEKDTGQPDLGVWLPSGQPKLTTFFSEILFSNISSVYALIFTCIVILHKIFLYL